MVNPDKRHMIVVKSGEDKKDSLRWCVVKEDIRKSRKITSPLFSGMIYSMMGWDSKYRYKILGYRIHAEGEEIFIFDLNDREMFLEGVKRPRSKDLKDGEGTGIKLVEKKTRSKGYLPGEWQKSFGLPPEEHEEALPEDSKVVLRFHQEKGFLRLPFQNDLLYRKKHRYRHLLHGQKVQTPKESDSKKHNLHESGVYFFLNSKDEPVQQKVPCQHHFPP